MRVASRGYLGIAVCLAVACLGFGLLAVDVRAEESLADFEAQIETAFAAAESALASEEARLDELATRNSRRALADGRPSIAQAAANVRLWERRIRELEAGERALRGELNGVLGSLGPDIAALAQRLSAQGEKAARERAQREAEERARREAEAARLAERERAETARAQRQKADLKWAVGHVFRDCPDCPEMVVVPSGSFLMGSPPSEEGRHDNEGPQHRVTIAEPFAVGVHEVTRGEFARFVSATGRSTGNSCLLWDGSKWVKRSGRNWRNPGLKQTDSHPVVCVSWDDAQAYVKWLSQETGHRYRLLSESEWEYVARAGTHTARYWGEGESGQCRHANGSDTGSDFGEGAAKCNDGHARTSPVGRYTGNGFGLHDALGNVWEWTQDCWNDSYRGAPADGRAWERSDCSWHVVRGGSWSYEPKYLRAANRGRYSTGYRGTNQGFRLARTLTP